MASNEKFLNQRQRYQPVTLPQDFSDEEMARDWTLSEADQQEIGKYRKNSRLFIATQLCAVRLYGRFVMDVNDLSPRIINYLNGQLAQGVRRAQLMGFFLVPTVLFYSGLQPALAELLGVQARVSPSFEALAIQKLALAIAVAVGVGVFAYFLAQRLQRWLGGYRGAILFLAPLVMFALLQTGRQVLHPQDSSQLFDWGPSQDWIAGEIDRVVDGDTVYVASSGRRYYRPQVVSAGYRFIKLNTKQTQSNTHNIF